MAAQLGSAMLLKVDSDGVGTFVTVGGIQSPQMSINNEMIDITSQDETDRFREALAGGGVRSVSLSGEGVFKDDAAIATVNTYVLADTQREWQCIVPDFGTFEGVFQIASLEFSAEHNGEVRFSVQLESADVIVFTAA